MSHISRELFVYSFVARGTVILAEHKESYMSNSIPAMAAQCLQKLPSSSTKFTYNYENHTLNFLVEDGYAYCVVGKANVGRRISEAFLDRVKADFNKKYRDRKADTKIVEKSLNKEFGPTMKQQMKYVEEHQEEMDKVVKLKAQVSDVISVMTDNVTKVMERGENLTTISEKAEDLRDQAKMFEKQGGQIRRKMWFQNMKIKLAVLGIILVLVLIIWLSICGGFVCN